MWSCIVFSIVLLFYKLVSSAKREAKTTYEEKLYKILTQVATIAQTGLSLWSKQQNIFRKNSYWIATNDTFHKKFISMQSYGEFFKSLNMHFSKSSAWFNKGFCKKNLIRSFFAMALNAIPVLKKLL